MNVHILSVNEVYFIVFFSILSWFLLKPSFKGQFPPFMKYHVGLLFWPDLRIVETLTDVCFSQTSARERWRGEQRESLGLRPSSIKLNPLSFNSDYSLRDCVSKTEVVYRIHSLTSWYFSTRKKKSLAEAPHPTQLATIIGDLLVWEILNLHDMGTSCIRNINCNNRGPSCKQNISWHSRGPSSMTNIKLAWQWAPLA